MSIRTTIQTAIKNTTNLQKLYHQFTICFLLSFYLLINFTKIEKKTFKHQNGKVAEQI